MQNIKSLCNPNISLIFSSYDFPTKRWFCHSLKNGKPNPVLWISVFIEKSKFASHVSKES